MVPPTPEGFDSSHLHKHVHTVEQLMTVFQPQLSLDCQLGYVDCIKEAEMNHIFTFHLRKYKARVWCGGWGGVADWGAISTQRTGCVVCLKTVLSEQPGGILSGLQWQLLWQTWGNIQGISWGKWTIKFHITPWLEFCTKGQYSNNTIHKNILYFFL